VGVPDMVLEVLSPSTAYKDKTAKLRIYKAAGVREYWIVDPAYQFVEVYLLQENAFPTVYNKNDIVTVSIFEQCDIHLQEIFD
jgi:Uma2 family endonuclease